MRVVVVEDDEGLGRAIHRTLSGWGAEVVWARTCASGLQALAHRPDLLVLDVGLPDGSGIALAEAANRIRPVPMMLAISGGATAMEGFRLAELGVRGYLPKPLSFLDFTATIEAMLMTAPDPTPYVMAAVGHRSFHEMLTLVRRTMAEQALARSGGNRTGAARLLGVTRQAVQQLVRDLEIEMNDV